MTVTETHLPIDSESVRLIADPFIGPGEDVESLRTEIASLSTALALLETAERGSVSVSEAESLIEKLEGQERFYVECVENDRGEGFPPALAKSEAELTGLRDLLGELRRFVKGGDA
jgi:hypothetical protein